MDNHTAHASDTFFSYETFLGSYGHDLLTGSLNQIMKVVGQKRSSNPRGVTHLHSVRFSADWKRLVSAFASFSDSLRICSEWF